MDRPKTNSKNLPQTARRAVNGSVKILTAFLTLIIAACATYQSKVQHARDLLDQGQYQQAAEALQVEAVKPGDDQLVYLLDYATALQAAGNYEESNKRFQAADELTKQKDYHSVSRIAGSMLFAEELVQYKGDDFEKLLINAMGALNYLMLNDRESALVEIRRLQEKLEYFRLEEKKEYEQNTFALYLSALLWEADGNWDSAYIDYEKAYKRDPNISYIREDLVRSATRAGRTEAAAKWRREFDVKVKPEWSAKDSGELIVIYAQGWGPRKAPDPASPRFPTLLPVRSYIERAKVTIAGVEEAKTQPIYDVTTAAIKTLQDQYAALAAKRVAGLVAKEVVAHQVRKENEGLGNLLWLTMHLSDRADLRQWSSLPASFQVYRRYLKAGQYDVNLEGLNVGGTPLGEKSQSHKVTIKPRKKTFLYWRTFR